MQRALLAAALCAAAFCPALPAAAQDAGAQDAAAPDAAAHDAGGEATASGGSVIPVFPLRATDQASVPGRGGVDPWSGLVITLTPPDEDVDGTGVSEPAREEPAVSQGAPIVVDPAAPSEDTVIDPLAASPDESEMPSLWTSLELSLGGEPTVPPATAASRVAVERVRTPAPQPVPTTFNLVEGPARFSVLTSVSTAQPLSSALATEAGGGSGEVKGRVGYEMDNLSLYGVGGVGAASNLGTVSLYDSALFGTAYSVPLTSFGFGNGDRVGAKVEIDRAATTATAVEVRSADGRIERYIAVERSAPVEGTASSAVRAGVTGRF